MLEWTGAITIEVPEPIMFVLAYRIVLASAHLVFCPWLPRRPLQHAWNSHVHFHFPFITLFFSKRNHFSQERPCHCTRYTENMKYQCDLLNPALCLRNWNYCWCCCRCLWVMRYFNIWVNHVSCCAPHSIVQPVLLLMSKTQNTSTHLGLNLPQK